MLASELEIILSDMADHDGALPGDDALRLMGRAALAAAGRHSNGRVVMTGANGLRFYRPVPVGHSLDLTARVIHADGTAMTVLVDGMAQSPTGGRRTLALSGYFQVATAADGSGG